VSKPERDSSHVVGSGHAADGSGRPGQHLPG